MKKTSEIKLTNGVRVINTCVVVINLAKHGEIGKFGNVLEKVNKKLGGNKNLLFSWTDESGHVILVLDP